MLTKPFKPLALAFLVNLIISVEDKIKYWSGQLDNQPGRHRHRPKDFEPAFEVIAAEQNGR